MLRKVLFIYKFGKRTPAKVTKTNRELFGYTDRSHHGKYRYWRDGLLSKVAHKRIAKGVILTDFVNNREVMDALEKVGAKKIKRFYIRVDKVVG